MKFGLKKLARGIRKVAQKNRGGVGRLVKKVGPGLAMAAVGATAPALLVKAASAAKSLGKKARGLETPKSLVPVVRAAQVSVRKYRTKMPGGAPMPSMPSVPNIERPAVGMAKSGAVGARKSLYKGSPKSRKPKRARTKPNGTRKAPSAKQLAARAKFAAAAKARAKARKAA